MQPIAESSNAPQTHHCFVNWEKSYPLVSPNSTPLSPRRSQDQQRHAPFRPQESCYDRALQTIMTSVRASTRPNWAEVSASALRHNFRTLQQHVGPSVTICAVVKCDAYGHGSEACAHALEQEGASWFGVTSTDEGVALRDAGISSRILILVGAWRGEEEDALRYGLTPTVSRIEDVEAVALAASRIGRREPVPVHLKLDTGMARLGLPLSELEVFASRLRAMPLVASRGRLQPPGVRRSAGCRRRTAPAGTLQSGPACPGAIWPSSTAPSSGQQQRHARQARHLVQLRASGHGDLRL